MKFLSYGKDGGPYSTVWGFWLIEIKNLFSIVLLRFEDGSREAFHTHAFNSISWLLSGRLIEHFIPTATRITQWRYRPSPLAIWTPRERFHKVESMGRSWVISFRGPWAKTWKEYIPEEDKTITLTNGRQVVG